jgi:hypothetical protein
MQQKTSPKHNQYQVVAGFTEPASIDQQLLLLIVFSCWGLLLEYKARNHHHHPFQY